MREIERIEFCDIPVYFIALCVKIKKSILQMLSVQIVEFWSGLES